MYKYYQPNKKDKSDKYDDCVVRAFTKAFDLEWIEAFNELLPYAIKYQCMPNNKKCYEQVIKNHGGVWNPVKAVSGEKKPTPATFTRSRTTGIYILRLAHHLVAVQDGVYYDTWDCGDKSIYGYWKIK